MRNTALFKYRRLRLLSFCGRLGLLSHSSRFGSFVFHGGGSFGWHGHAAGFAFGGLLFFAAGLTFFVAGRFFRCFLFCGGVFLRQCRAGHQCYCREGEKYSLHKRKVMHSKTKLKTYIPFRNFPKRLRNVDMLVCFVMY